VLSNFRKSKSILHWQNLWGGVESLINHPVMTHASIPEDKRIRSWNCSDLVLRLSVGVEDIEDLLFRY
jgi:cystathionine beta-lyase/cystathionine gamma-synthase